jgi:hypothetical protein
VSEWNTPGRAALVATRLDPVVANGEAIGVAVVRAVVRARPLEEVYEIVHRGVDAYRGTAGAVAQCPCCRRLRDRAEPARWDLVPELLAPAPPVEHVLCELCAELHYRIE